MTYRLPHATKFITAIVLCAFAVVAVGDADAKSRKKKRRSVHKPVAGAVVPKPERPMKLLTRAEILGADPERLARIGRHIIIGFHSFADAKALVEKRAISGIFITDHNVRGRTADQLALAIADLQAIRASQNLPPLIVAADQEGGTVSRLSPPLQRQMSLARLLNGKTSDAQIEPLVRGYARTQAAELKRLGVTLNFSPVVDLNINPQFRGDGETRLRLRSISDNPNQVAKVADWYCDTLAESGLRCTLKHFPGLGRAKRDTHIVSTSIDASQGQLELNDWIPFRRVMEKPNAATMLAHVRLPAIDGALPVSYSAAVIGGLIRSKWAYDGLVITDDFSMGAVTRSKDGVGGAAIKALQAGADLVLVSFSEKHLNAIMSALLEADEKGELDPEKSAKSFERIKAFAAPAKHTH